MKNELLLNTQIEKKQMTTENNSASSENNSQWWGTKRMTVDEFNDLMTDLHWSKYTRVKIEVVQDSLNHPKKK